MTTVVVIMSLHHVLMLLGLTLFSMLHSPNFVFKTHKYHFFLLYSFIHVNPKPEVNKFRTQGKMVASFSTSFKCN